MLRACAALILAVLIAYGVGSQLSWEEWQPIGWAVILGGGVLSVTGTRGGRDLERLLAATPSLTFLAGYTVFYWKASTWQVVDILAICCFIGAAIVNLRKR